MLDFITLLGCLCTPIAALAIWKMLMRDLEQHEIRMSQLVDNYSIRAAKELAEYDPSSGIIPLTYHTVKEADEEASERYESAKSKS